MHLRTVHAPTPREFAEISAGRQPVVLTGLTDSWPAMTHWRDLDYLRACVGEEVVPVEVYPDGDTGRHASYISRNMRVNEFFDGMAPHPGRPALFLIVPLAGHLPRLLDDIVAPSILPKVTRTIWLYGDRTFSNLHFHPFQHSLACQVVGRKRFGLYPPEETPHLYPRHWLSKWYEFTRIERFNPVDLDRYPRVRRARGVEVTLEPGMSLFIPRHWWHWVSTDEVASHVLYYFDATDPLRWVWTSPGRRSLFWKGRQLVAREATRWRRKIERSLGFRPPAPAAGDQPSR